MTVNIQQLEIPKASKHAQTVLDQLCGDMPDLRVIERELMQDPMLASTVIRYANSPLYRRDTPITNVPTALRLIGLKSIKSAVVSAIMRAMIPQDTALANKILAHMVEVSAFCRIVAQHTAAELADDLEYVGLVHDVGIFVLAANFPTEYKQLTVTMNKNDQVLDELERLAFGLSHDQVNASVAGEFRLAPAYIELIKDFHLPKLDIVNASKEFCILGLAHVIYNMIAQRNEAIIETVPLTQEDMQNKLGIDDGQFESICQDAQSVIGYCY